MTWSYVIYSYILLPLVLIGYTLLGIWLIWRVVALRISRVLKLALVVVIPLVLLLIPTADVIVGRSQFSQLCEQEAAVKVFRPVVLENKYRRPDGSPNARFTPGRLGYLIGDKYEMKFSEQQLSSWARITRVTAEIRDIERNEVLGLQTDFHYWGGWLARQLPGHLRADTCSQLREERTALEKIVFAAPKG